MKFVQHCWILLSVVGVVVGEICTDSYGFSQFCLYGCCGLDDDYCCDNDSSWGVGSIAGTVVGLTFFFIFLTIIVVCCRRRRLNPIYVQRSPVAVIQSSSVGQMSSVSANVAPVYPQYPQQYSQQLHPPPYANKPPEYSYDQ